MSETFKKMQGYDCLWASRDQTIGELLNQMDGFFENDNIMVIGATNHMDALDPAIERRFDLKVDVGLPQSDKRLAILQLYCKGKPLASDVHLERMSGTMTGGFNCAQLKDLVNQAALQAAMHSEMHITAAHFEEAWNQVITGVDEIRFFTGDPTLFFIFQVWDIGLSSEQTVLRVTSREAGDAIEATWDQAAGAGGVRTWTVRAGGPAGATTATKDLDDAVTALTTLFADRWYDEQTDPATLARYGLGEAAGPQGWVLRAELTRQVPGQPEQVATLWIGGAHQMEGQPGAGGERRFFRVSPDQAMQGDLVGSLRTKILTALRDLVR